MTATTQIIDKSGWGIGPWQEEPDRAEWAHAGMPCLAVRHDRMGHWCGYIAVPPGHPLHGKSYHDADVEVHGGLTYSDKCNGHICHVPQAGEPDDVWWFGFDCAHCGDFSPRTNIYHGAYPWPLTPYNHAVAVAAHDWRVDTYRTLDYLMNETNLLADQLAALDLRVARRQAKRRTA